MNIRERIIIMFPEIVGIGRIADEAVERLIEHAIECDEANGNGWGMLKDVVDGVVPSIEIREAAENAICAQAEIMVDQMRHVVRCDAFDAQDVTQYFRIRTVYDAVSEAGLV